MNALGDDFRYALRQVRRNPGFTAVACFTLALGIGATTSVFSVVNALVLRPLLFRSPGDLVFANPVWSGADGPSSGFVSAAEFVEYRRRNRTFVQLASINGSGSEITGMYILAGEEGAEYAPGAQVSANFFETLGVLPMAGRSFEAADETSDPPAAVIISHRLWQRRFGGQPVTGRVITVDNDRMTIVGIMPPSFDFPHRADVWVPMPLAKLGPVNRQHAVQPFGRLSTALAPAQSDLDGIAASLARENPKNAGKRLHLVPLDDALRGRVRIGLLMLFGAAGLVLLIAVSNVANLQLLRAGSRLREMAVRASLGAGPGRLVRQLWVENGVISLLGAAAGAALAQWALPLLLRMNPATADTGAVRLDPVVLCFAVAVAGAAAVLFGLAPARVLVRQELAQALRTSGRGANRAGTRTREALVAVQVGLAFVLVTGSGLLVTSLLRLQRVDPGFDPRNVASVLLTLTPARYPDRATRVNFQRQILERVRSLPGVRSAGIISQLPVRGFNSTTFVVREDRRGLEEPSTAQVVWLSPEALSALRIPLLRGRMFTEREGVEAPAAVLVNEALARRFYPGEDPVGKRLIVTGTFAPTRSVQEIAGVVGNAHHVTLAAPAGPAVYVPSLALRWAHLFLRTDGDPLSLAPAVRRELQRIDRDHPVAEFQTLDGVIGESLAAPRFRTMLLAVFGACALLLAAVGLYGVLSYSVAQRGHELAVRVALGARPAHLMKVVVLQGLLLSLMGIAAAFPVAVGVGRGLAAFLFEISPASPAVFTAAFAVLILVALAATLVPAARSTRADPNTALRQE